MSAHLLPSRRRRAATAFAVGALTVSALAVAAPAGAATPTAAAPAANAPTAAAAPCPTGWGTGAKGASAAELSGAPLTGVRSGRHACFDRVVVDVRGPLSPRDFQVTYVRAVHADGSGELVPLRGGARLQVVVGSPAYDENGRPTYTPRNPAELVNSRGYRTLRQVAWAGSFEGQSTIGIGVRTRLPMRAFVLRSGATSRLVVDVAHR